MQTDARKLSKVGRKQLFSTTKTMNKHLVHYSVVSVFGHFLPRTFIWFMLFLDQDHEQTFGSLFGRLSFWSFFTPNLHLVHAPLLVHSKPRTFIWFMPHYWFIVNPEPSFGSCPIIHLVHATSSFFFHFPSIYIPRASFLVVTFGQKKKVFFKKRATNTKVEYPKNTRFWQKTSKMSTRPTKMDRQQNGKYAHMISNFNTKTKKSDNNDIKLTY
jgi:hypothetical protein